MEAAPADAAVAAGESPFLRCTTLLNDDVLTSYLLPKLAEQGSAGAVALICIQLRKLCQRSVHHLNLAKQWGADNPCRNPALAERLGTTFPNCNSLECAWDSSSLADVYLSIRMMLAGLPLLNTISIGLDSNAGDGELDPVLCQLQVHATGLRSLSLQLSDSWVDHALTWDSLGKMVNLTGLEVTFIEEEVPCVLTNLQSLTGLSKLQSLAVIALDSYWDGWEQPYFFNGDEDKDEAELHAAQQFPGPLTSLTKLWLPLDVMPILGSFSELVSLQDLQLQSTNGIPMLCTVAWVALAQLTSLTRLHVSVEFESMNDPGVESLYGVLRQLQGLRAVGSSVWLPSFLPVLQTLTHLTAVYGSWYDNGSTGGPSGLACPHVRELGEVMNIPFNAFPNLECVAFTRVSIRDLAALSRSCTGLQKLVLLGQYSNPVGGMRVGSAEGLEAFGSLAHLQHLTHLDLAPGNDAELVAFTSAAASMSNPPQLQCLHVRGPLTLFALMQLQSVRGLRELFVHVADRQDVRGTFALEAARMWLVGLAVVPKVCLVLKSAEQQGVFHAATRWAAELGLPLPAVLKISVV